MINKDLTTITRMMTRHYKSRKMSVNTIVEKVSFIKPRKLKITFDYEKEIFVDMELLNRRLNRHIGGVRHFFVSVNYSCIEIHVILYWRRKLRDYDFEFRDNLDMKKTRITIVHQLEKTQHNFMVVNPYKLISSEVEKIKIGNGCCNGVFEYEVV